VAAYPHGHALISENEPNRNLRSEDHELRLQYYAAAIEALMRQLHDDLGQLKPPPPWWPPGINASRAVHDPLSCFLDLPSREMLDLR
jgi:hypothetical protein